MIIIDVGAHNGEAFSIPYAKDENNLVYAIEPNPQLVDKISLHQLPNLKVFCLAIGEQDGTSDFYINYDDQTSSLLTSNCVDQWLPYAEQLKTAETIEVKVSRLDTFMIANSIAEVDLLKIDSQGFDFQIVKSAGDLIHKIKRIQLEVQVIPLYQGGGTKDEIVDFLETSGFRLVRRFPQTGGLEENLEFVRINRYAKSQLLNETFEVNVPYIGNLQMPQNDLVGKLLEQQVFEGPEQAFLWLYLRPGDTFLDCGAHAGLFSSIAARKLQNKGYILGFEPNIECNKLYQENLKSLGSRCFEALNIGLSDKAGSAELHLGKSGLSAFSTFAAGAINHKEISKEVVRVQLSTLDEIIAERALERVDLAKLDVEGWEAAVIRGATVSIQQGKFPVWMVEFTEENATAAGSTTSALAELIKSFGYTLCRFDATRLRLVPETRHLKYAYANIFAVLDIQTVNKRLEEANSFAVSIAKDIITRWDLATRFQESEALLQVIENNLRICENDRAERLKVINTLSAQLAEYSS